MKEKLGKKKLGKDLSQCAAQAPLVAHPIGSALFDWQLN